MSNGVWEKIAYDDIKNHSDDLFHLQQPTPDLFDVAMPRSTRRVRLLSLYGNMVGRAPGFRRLGILAERQDLADFCRYLRDAEDD